MSTCENTETVAADAEFRPGLPRPESAREPVQGGLGQARDHFLHIRSCIAEV
jgi:hypothetical protein